MPKTQALPIPIEIHRRIEDCARLHGDAQFLVCAMFTPSHSAHADRLARSCRDFGLPHALFEVPAVHRSTSLRGIGDDRFTKANLISHALQEYRAPVLYLDADCVIEEPIPIFEQLIVNDFDFAIYNWLFEEHTECYYPFELGSDGDYKIRRRRCRYYMFSHSVDFMSFDQLICSGAVQFYNNTRGSRDLLTHWHDTVVSNIGIADDQCLDFAFNNPIDGKNSAKACWLPKSHCRYPWWIYQKPAINHPDFPSGASGFIDFSKTAARRAFYPERARLKNVSRYVAPGLVIDTQDRRILKKQGGRLTPVGPIPFELWL